MQGYMSKREKELGQEKSPGSNPVVRQLKLQERGKGLTPRPVLDVFWAIGRLITKHQLSQSERQGTAESYA